MGGRRQPDGMSEANLQRHYRRRGASTHDAFRVCRGTTKKPSGGTQPRPMFIANCSKKTF